LLPEKQANKQTKQQFNFDRKKQALKKYIRESQLCDLIRSFRIPFLKPLVYLVYGFCWLGKKFKPYKTFRYCLTQ